MDEVVFSNGVFGRIFFYHATPVLTCSFDFVLFFCTRSGTFGFFFNKKLQSISCTRSFLFVFSPCFRVLCVCFCIFLANLNPIIVPFSNHASSYYYSCIIIWSQKAMLRSSTHSRTHQPTHPLTHPLAHSLTTPNRYPRRIVLACSPGSKRCERLRTARRLRTKMSRIWQGGGVKASERA